MYVSRTRCTFAALAVAAMSLAGCGSSTEPATITMSPSDVALMLSELDSAFAGAVSFTRMGPSTPGGAPRFVRVPSTGASTFLSKPSLSTFSETNNCNSGGSVTVAGTDNVTSSTDNFDLTTSFNACKTPHFTVGGSLEFKGNSTSNGSTFSFSLSVNGSLTVNTSDGRSGSCPISFTASGDQNSATVSGTVCGEAANGTVSG